MVCRGWKVWATTRLHTSREPGSLTRPVLSSCPKTRTEPQARILEAFSKFAESSRRGTGSAIGDPCCSHDPSGVGRANVRRVCKYRGHSRASCPKTQTNSRPLRRDVSDSRCLRLVRQWKLESPVMSTPMQPLTWLVVAIAGWIQRDQQRGFHFTGTKGKPSPKRGRDRVSL